MSVMTKDRVANVIEVRHLYVIKKNAILEFAGVSHHHAIASDHVLAHVATAADPAIFTNPCRAFQKRTLLNDCSFADEDMVTDERLAHQFAQNAGFQSKLEITGDLFKRVPDVILVLEQLRMCRVFEVKIISGHEHFQPSRWRIECAVASAFFWIASASSRSRTFSSGTIQGRTWQNKSWFR